VAVAVGGLDQESDLYLYDAATKAEKFKVTFPDSLRSIAFAPAGDVIALGFARKRLLLVDARTGGEVAQLAEQPADAPPPASSRFARVAFSPDGKWLAASAYDDEIRIYDVQHHTLAKTLKGQDGRILTFAFSPDQKQLISCTAAGPAMVWDLEHAERDPLPLPPGYRGVASVSYSPDGKLLATGFNSGSCCLQDAATGSVLHTLNAHVGVVNEATFSPDGKLLATAGEDGLVKLWDVATATLARTYQCHAGSALYVRFSLDGKSFVTAGRDAEAKLWWVLPPETK
jgi:WD40 repeat protein